MAEAHLVPGETLETLARRGPAAIPSALAGAFGGSEPATAAVLLGALCLGKEALDEIRSALTRPDDAAKLRLILGLGSVGFAPAEGYLARIVREAPDDQAVAGAVTGLGQIGGERTLPLVVGALDHAVALPQACRALAAYGTAAALEALRRVSDRPEALEALARCRDPDDRDLFLGALDGPHCAVALEGLAGLGDPELCATIRPYLTARPRSVRRAAFGAYARLGAYPDPSPLLESARRHLESWMIASLGQVAHPDVGTFLAEQLAPDRAPGGWRRWLGFRRSSGPDVGTLARALRGASAPAVLRALAAHLATEADPTVLWEILLHPDLPACPEGIEAIRRVWNRDVPILRYLSLRPQLQHPTQGFLRTALEQLALPGPIVPGGQGEPERVRQSQALDHNPCLLLGEFLESGLGDPATLIRELARRFSDEAFPPDTLHVSTFGRPLDFGLGKFFEAFTEAHPAMGSFVIRVANLLDGITLGDGPASERFVAWCGWDRSPVQRAVARGFRASLGRFIQGRNDRDLPLLDPLAEALPRDRPWAFPLGDDLAAARRRLMAECRDMALIPDRATHTDMVLVEMV